MKTLFKNLLVLFALCVMLFPATAYAADQVSTTSSPSNNPANPQPIVVASYVSTEFTPTDTVKTAIAIAEVANDYLDGTGLLSDYYSVQENGWICLKGAVLKGLRYDYLCPSAIFPQDNWTPESVIASYKDQTAPWVDDPYYQPSFVDCQSLWSADYRYHFAVKDGWLTINGALNTPFDCATVEDITPQALLEAYQSGEWDGNEKLWSNDYSTYAQISGNGSLFYSFVNPMLTPNEEARQYAYTGCNDTPWWHNGTDSLWPKYQGFSIDEFRYSHTDGKHYNANIDCFPDLPNGKLDPDLGQPIYTQHDEDGTWIATTTGVYRFREGKILEQWKLELDVKTGFVELKTDCYKFDANYVYTGDKLVELLPNDKIRRVISGNVCAATNYEGSFWAYYIQDHDLMYWKNQGGKVTISTLIDDNVVDLKNAGNTIFFTMKDGYTYGTYGYACDEFDPVCIGRISLEAVVEEWLDPDQESITLEWLASKYANTITGAPLLTSPAVQNTTTPPPPPTSTGE